MKSIGWEKYPVNLRGKKGEGNDYNEDDGYSQFEKSEKLGILKELVNNRKTMRTPQGIYLIDENASLGNIFNFWLGHTNFTITHHIKNEIENVEGVETLDVMTRYRFRIGIGKIFRFDDVRKSIENNILSEPSRLEIRENQEISKDDQDRIFKVKREMSENASFWAGYLLPNGKIKCSVSSELNKRFQDDFDTFKQSRDGVGGVVFSYLDEEQVNEGGGERK